MCVAGGQGWLEPGGRGAIWELALARATHTLLLLELLGESFWGAFLVASRSQMTIREVQKRLGAEGQGAPLGGSLSLARAKHTVLLLRSKRSWGLRGKVHLWVGA